MRAIFTFDEYVYNRGPLNGAKIYHEDDDTLHTIDYVKLKKGTRQIMVYCTDGESFLANQDTDFEWEVVEELEEKPVTKKKNRRKKKK